jgi:hypothetical protein
MAKKRLKKDKFLQYLAIVLAILFLVSLFFHAVYIKKNNKLELRIDKAKRAYNLLANKFIVLSEVYRNLIIDKNRIVARASFISGSVKEIECYPVGARRGVLSCSENGWLACYDSLDDMNGGDASPECCKADSGTWQEDRCCSPGKGNSNWSGKTGSCNDAGYWVPNSG